MPNQIDERKLVDGEGIARLVLKLICPLLVVVLPILLYVLWKVPNPEGPEHASITLVLSLNLVVAASWGFAMYYGVTSLGWIDWIKNLISKKD